MITPSAERFGRARRLRDRRDFQRVSREGMRVTTQSFLLLVADHFPTDSAGPSRLGLTVSRRVGGSVVRNLVKRRIREWFRREAETLPASRDVVVIARPRAAGLSQAAVDAEFAGAVSQLRATRPR